MLLVLFPRWADFGALIALTFLDIQLVFQSFNKTVNWEGTYLVQTLPYVLIKGYLNCKRDVCLFQRVQYIYLQPRVKKKSIAGAFSVLRWIQFPPHSYRIPKDLCRTPWQVMGVDGQTPSPPQQSGPQVAPLPSLAGWCSTLSASLTELGWQASACKAQFPRLGTR